MGKLLKRYYWNWLLFWAGVVSLMADRHYYVSPSGSDAAPGTIDQPFATIQKARDVIRPLVKNESILVFFRGGTYYMGETLVFEPEDSGTPSAPVTYLPYEEEEVIISGGFEVDGWQRQGNLLVTTLGDVASGDLYFKEIYVNDERRDRARNPDKGDFFRVDGSYAEKPKGAFRFHDGGIDSYENQDDVNVVMYQSWLAVHLWIDNLDLGQNRVDFSPEMVWDVGYFENIARYYVENAFELLDQPGEWYLNRQTGELFYYPLAGETAENIQTIAPLTDRVIEFRGDPDANAYVESIHLDGLKIRHADWILRQKIDIEGQAHCQLDDAMIYMKGAVDCRIRDCEVALGGAHGIIMTLGCMENVVQQCHIHALGGGGVFIGHSGGWNSCETLDGYNMIMGNSVKNCYIHDLTHVHHGSVGVLVGCAAQNTITQNEISNLDYTGISVGWCWSYDDTDGEDNIISYNHIHHLGQGEMSDMGGVYTLGLAPGTVVSNNLIHDVYSYSYGGWGLYPDQASTDVIFENNIVYNTKSAGFHLHFGQDLSVRNNIFAFAEEQEMQRGKNEEGHSMTLERNIILSRNGTAVGGNWSDDNFTINNNLYWNATDGQHLDFGMETLEDWQARGHDVNSSVADPLFVDPSNYNFDLQGNSPAYDLDFQRIEIEQIGLQGEAEWTSLPDQYPDRPVNPVAKGPVMPLFGVTEFFDDFESTQAGSFPRAVLLWGISGQTAQTIIVTDEKAASGSHSLKIQDKPLTQNTWEPFMTYKPYWYESGRVTIEFDILQENGSNIRHEWRDLAGWPDGVGPSVQFSPGGTWRSGGESFKLPVEGWYHVELTCNVGDARDGTYDVSVTVGDQTITKEGAKYSSTTWQELYEVYFISDETNDAASFLDNVRLTYEIDETAVRNESGETDSPSKFRLSQNYPNPFNPLTVIEFELPAREQVTLTVFNLQGQVVVRPLARVMEKGAQSINFDAGNLASGIYWYRLETPTHTGLKKMVVLK